MLSAEDIATVKLAIHLCNGHKLKKEIFCLPDTNNSNKSQSDNDEETQSDYDKESHSDEKLSSYEQDMYYFVKKKWDKNIEEKTSVILSKLGLGNSLIEKVSGYTILIGMRMVSWATYHEQFLGFPRDSGLNILKNYFFTSKGIVDSKKISGELIKCPSMDAIQKYKLACIYCHVDQIPILFKEISVEDKKEFYDSQKPHMISQPALVKYWSYFLMGDADKLSEEQSVGEYLLKIAIETGSKATVEYCLGRTEINKNERTIINVALKIVNIRICIGQRISCVDYDFPTILYERDELIFMHLTDYASPYEFWNPGDLYIDILCFLFNKMTEVQQIEFFMLDVKGENYQYNLGRFDYSGALSYFLFWPYQDFFLKAINLIWEFLPKWIFTDLLVKICEKIEPKKGTFKYGEGKTFNYRKLLKEFWCKAPQRFHRYLCTIVKETSESNRRGKSKRILDVIRKLLFLFNFTNEDRRNLELILVSVTDEEKKNIIISEEGKTLLLELIEKEKFGRFDVFVSYLFSSLEEEANFKKEFILKKHAQDVCLKFAKHKKWEAAKSFIKWAAFSEDEVIQFKKKFIFSDDGKRLFKDLIINNPFSLSVANKFCDLFASSEDESTEFKKNLIFSEIGDKICSELIINDKLDHVDEFIGLCLSTELDILKFKKNFVNDQGGKICKQLISSWHHDSVCNVEDDSSDYSESYFVGGKWELIEVFLTWCFSCKEEIEDFKRAVLVDVLGKDILYSLLSYGQVDEADKFFSWLNLSFYERKILKKEVLETLVPDIYDLITDTEYTFAFHWKGDHDLDIERLTRWFLNDKETALMFKDRFGEVCKLRREEREVNGLPELGQYETEIQKIYKLIAELS